MGTSKVHNGPFSFLEEVQVLELEGIVPNLRVVP